MRGGRIARIDGGTANEVTRGYICAKVRHFDRRVYGDDRLHFPAVRNGAKGAGIVPPRQLGRRARLDRRRTCGRPSRRIGGEAILPLCYGGSNGLLTQDYADAMLFRRLGASRLLRTVCAAPDRRRQPGALRQDGVGGLPGLSRGAADRHLGRQPRRVGHPPDAVSEGGARRAARRSSSSIRARRGSRGRPTSTFAVRPGTDVVGGARHPPPPVRERRAPTRRSSRAHTTGAERLRERAPPWTFERAAEVTRRAPPSGFEQRRGAVRHGAARRWSSAAGGSSATATAATPRRRCWRCRRSAASSACAAAATR